MLMMIVIRRARVVIVLHDRTLYSLHIDSAAVRRESGLRRREAWKCGPLRRRRVLLQST
jgi:hypothetical protein